MAKPSSDAILDEIVCLAQAGLDRHDFAREATRVLRRSVPFDGVRVVWFDAATALPVGRWTDGSPTGSELDEHDVAEFRRLAASGLRAARLSQATGDDLDGRRRRRTPGRGDELRAVCAGAAGVWGQIVLYRGRDVPNFATRDVDLLASLSGGCREVMRVKLERDLSADAGGRDRGLLLLDEDNGIHMADDAAAAWLDELRSHRRRLPLVVTAVADRARAIASGRHDVPATARVRAASGRWVLVGGSVLGNGTHVRTAVTLEPARAPELAELVADACGLTAREWRVTELVAQGLCTAAIAARLYLSTYTVQDHLKAIFEKLDVSSRGQLVARLFVDHSLAGAQISPS
jgi:DNA-binding NarL/FixJ family response regulator